MGSLVGFGLVGLGWPLKSWSGWLSRVGPGLVVSAFVPWQPGVVASLSQWIFQIANRSADRVPTTKAEIHFSFVLAPAWLSKKMSSTGNLVRANELAYKRTFQSPPGEPLLHHAGGLAKVKCLAWFSAHFLEAFSDLTSLQ